MSDDWILDVLTDLHAYASKNGLPELADKLDDTRRTATREIVHGYGAPEAAGINAIETGTLYRPCAARDLA